MNATILIPLAIALIGFAGTYIATTRKLSGKVSTSTAAELWDESKNIRDDYRSRITELNDILGRCEARIEALEKRNEQLYLENGRLARMLEEHEQTISELRQQVHRLAGENDVLKTDNGKLRKRVSELEAA